MEEMKLFKVSYADGSELFIVEKTSNLALSHGDSKELEVIHETTRISVEQICTMDSIFNMKIFIDKENAKFIIPRPKGRDLSKVTDEPLYGEFLTLIGPNEHGGYRTSSGNTKEFVSSTYFKYSPMTDEDLEDLLGYEVLSVKE